MKKTTRPAATRWAWLLAACLWGPAQAALLIGQTTGVTGNSAPNVRETDLGARLWFDAVNARGGVNGERIELLTLDDRGDADLAQRNAATLIDKRNVLALFMIRGTPQNQAVLPLLETHGVPLVAPSTGAMVLHRPVRKWVFNVRTSYQAEAEKAVVQLASMSVSRIAVLRTDDSFGADTFAGTEAGFARTGLKPVLVSTFAKTSPEFADVAPRVVAAQAQAVIVLGTSTSVVKATKAIRAAGSKATVLTLSNNATSALIRELGTYARGVVVTQVFPNERSLAVPMINEATQLLRARGDEVLSPAMVEGFAGARVMVEALRRAGPKPTRDRIRAALEQMNHFDLGGVSLDFSPTDHSGLRFTDLSVIGENGVFQR